MPLIKGFSAQTFEKNVRMLRKEGRQTRQCVAIAYKEAREALSRAKKRETKKLREAWKVAIAAGLEGTGKKPAKPAKRPAKVGATLGRRSHYRVSFKTKSGRGKGFWRVVIATSLTDAERMGRNILKTSEGKRFYIDKVVKMTKEQAASPFGGRPFGSNPMLMMHAIDRIRDEERRGAKSPKKASSRAPNQPGHLMLRLYGPPKSWSGAVAGMLTESQLAGMRKAWREMTPAQRKETKAAFRAKMNFKASKAEQRRRIPGRTREHKEALLGHFGIKALPRDRTLSGGPITARHRAAHAARLKRGLHKYYVVSDHVSRANSRSDTTLAKSPTEAAKLVEKRNPNHKVRKVEEMW